MNKEIVENITYDEKEFFLNLFKGREGVFAKQWEDGSGFILDSFSPNSFI